MSEYIWYAECDAVFGGCGLRATGRTEKEAKDALWKLYLETSPAWNKQRGGENKPGHPTYEKLNEWFGIYVRKWKVGKAYFGDEDEPHQRNSSERETLEEWNEQKNES
jgi:hypothetical protein